MPEQVFWCLCFSVLHRWEKKKISGSKEGTVVYLFLFLSAFHNSQIVCRGSCDHWFLSNLEALAKIKKGKDETDLGMEKTHHQRDSKTLNVVYHPASSGLSDTKKGNMQNVHVCENKKKWVWQHDWYPRISFSFYLSSVIIPPCSFFKAVSVSFVGVR